MGAWLALGGALLATALAQVAFKLRFTTERRAWLAAAILLFLCATGGSYLALQGLSIGMVYMSTALTQVLVAGLSRWVLREPLTADHGVGLVLIVAGIVVYAA
jgi:drug/metabolite transporter (DMT)-like permease